ncbi:hypothetical protein CVIRNUC_009496 [Coccomyxa viridis]|uniref:Cationic amino acid transporter C-terminal domain-containing protein n=1 Tax=Coccomyxa viridis TaxID=1274662 RepID=A0AAV1IK58_9CHLO|nr:hypothetical protein CVIRNUC_009496 [Coccomyxa viridis]
MSPPLWSRAVGDFDGSYSRALRSSLASNYSFKPRSLIDEERDRTEGGGKNLRRTLNGFQLICLGVGNIVGAGIFVTTGRVAHNQAGPAVIVSYLIAAVSALLSALCYAEFATEIPIAGGAMSYTSITGGPLLGWLVGTNLIIPHIVGNSGVLRNFSAYFAQLIDVQNTTDLQVHTEGGLALDFLAFGLSLALTALLILGTHETSLFNLVVTVIHVLGILFVIVAGMTQAQPSFVHPFAPFGIRGIFDGATTAFFAFIGADALANTAEEVINPKKDLPVGLLGSLGVVTVLYVLMAATIVLIVPYTLIDPKAAFAAAFQMTGLPWAKYIVAAAALMGILTGPLIGFYAGARIIYVLGRERLLPPVFSQMSARFGTPVVATAVQGVVVAFVTLFTPFEYLADATSISTLFSFFLVATSLLWRRYYGQGGAEMGASPWLPAAHIVWLLISSIGLSLWYQQHGHWGGLVGFGAAALASVVSLQSFVKQTHRPGQGSFAAWVPWVPAASIVLNVFLLGSVSETAWARFGIWIAATLVVFFLYSLPSSYAHSRSRLPASGHVGSHEEHVEDTYGDTTAVVRHKQGAESDNVLEHPLLASDR